MSDFFSETDFHSELFRKKNWQKIKISPIQFPKTQSQSYKKKKRLVNRFLKKKIQVSKLKIHFKTHLYPFHLKIGSRYLQKKNKKRLVNRFFKKKKLSFETKLPQ